MNKQIYKLTGFKKKPMVYIQNIREDSDSTASYTDITNTSTH